MAIKYMVSMNTAVGANEQVGAGQVSASGASGLTKEFGQFNSVAKAAFILDVSAIGAGTTLAVFIDAYEHATGKYIPIVTFPTQTAITGSTPLTPIVLDPLFYGQLRVRWTLTSGTTTATFSVVAYCLSEEPAV